MTSTANDTMVIVGAGQAGGRAALGLRGAGHRGPIVLIGAEAAAPYERPPLSKGYLAGDDDEARFTLADPAKLEEAGIDFLPGRSAVAIDRAARSVALDDGQRLDYARLLLATGRAPRRLPVPEEAAPAVHVLRDLEDARRLRARLVRGRRLAIIGGGFIGLEVAATARGRGVEVVVIEWLPRLLARLVPAALAARLERRHAAAGVDLRLGRRVERFAMDSTMAGGIEGGPVRLALDDGSAVEAEDVLIGIGAVPRTGLAEAAGLAVEDGILVDAALRTNDPAIYAAGDVAAAAVPGLPGRQRLESWDNAERQGTLAARTMLGAEETLAAATPDSWPWFWSDQYELTLQIAGHPDLAAETVERPSGEAGVVLFHLGDEGRIRAVSALGPAAIAREFKLARRLAEKDPSPDPALLRDPSSRLKTLLR